MKRLSASLAFAAGAVLVGSAMFAPALAAPPTVTPSPGYDARLQAQRTAPVVYEPVVRAAKPVSRRHAKRIHDVAH
jgi:hypothetical protein